jgi:biotin carboxylase
MAGERKPRLAVVAGSGSATIRDIVRFSADFAEPVLIFDADDESLRGLRAALEDDIECLEYRSGDGAGLLARHREAPLDAIANFAEDKIRFTSEVADQLGLRYHSPRCAEVLTDKSAQREALARAGLGIEFRVARDAVQAAELVREIGVPCVVKPLIGSGSRNTYAVDPADASAALVGSDQAYPAVVETRLRTGSHPTDPEVLADVVSVETLFLDGQPRHIAVSGRFRLAEPFRETGMVMPAQLPASVLDSVHDIASRALLAVGVNSGATHTEIKLTPEGPQVVEINGRLGGDVGRLTELSSGTSAVELALRAACELPFSQPHPTAVAGVSMLVPPIEATGLNSRVPAKELRSIDGVVAVEVHSRPGDAVDYRTGWWAHVACVWYRAADWSALRETHLAAQALVGSELEWAM